jgi:hypothetical protein
MISGHRQTARDVNVVSPMSARLATSCALAFLIACSSRHADAAPRAAIPKSSPRRKAAVPPPRPVTRAPRPVAIAAPPPAPAPAPAPPPEPEPPPAPARASLLDSSPPDVDRPSGPPPSLHHRATVTLNPLALVVGRYGANAEFVLAPHHAITASGYVQTFPSALIRVALPDLKSGAGPQARIGGELGYRLYTGSDGPTGFFVGPSLVAMPLAAPRLTEDYRAEIVSFTAYGAALDIGVQAIVGPGFTLGGGVGVMALAYSPPQSASPPSGIELPTYPQPHVLPRLLVMAGWAF